MRNNPITIILYSSFIIPFLSNCTDKPVSVQNIPTTDSIPSHYSKLKDLFQDITSDTLYVYSDWSPENVNFVFKGKAMDSLQVSLLPYDIRYNYNWNKDFGACFKFPLDSSHMALIGRTSGEYVSSAIKLFVFDLKKDSIIKTVNLADSWGDAGEVSVYSSCIFWNREKNFMILTYNWTSYDHGAGDVEKDTIVENRKYYHLYKLSPERVDTLSNDSAEIVQPYPAIVKKLSGL